MNERDFPATDTSDRRRAARRPHEGKVRVHLDMLELEGPASNISKTGVLFFTEGELTVTVEIELEGKLVQRVGHLVRCERIKGERRGWAVEFEHQ